MSSASLSEELSSRLAKLDGESKAKLKNILPSLMYDNLSGDVLDKVQELSEDEYEVFITMLAEAAQGRTDTYEEYTYEDYEEIPVDIQTFISDPDYLGRSTGNGESLYPYWKDTSSTIFDPGSSIQEVALTGAIGTGKSTAALIWLSYILYKLLCLKNPAEYYKLLEGSKIAIALFNISLNQVYGIGWDKYQSLLKNSPWFLRHGKLSGRNANRVMNIINSGGEIPYSLVSDLTYSPDKDIHIIVGSREDNFTGFDVFAGFLDEMNFYQKGSKYSDPNKFMDSGVMKVYSAIKRRIESRFMMMGRVPGLLILVSSKKSESSPLEVYISKAKHSSNGTLLVIDEPVWVVKNPPGKYSGNTFKLLVGDKYRPTQVLTESEDYQSYTDEGRVVIDVPIEHYESFMLDADKSLVDIAGMALVSGSKFIDANAYRGCIVPGRLNGFTQDVIEMGIDNNAELEYYFEFSRFSEEDKRLPMYAHWDASLTGDRTGLGIVAILRNRIPIKRVEEGDVVEVVDNTYRVIGSVGIQSTPGSQIPFRRILKFLLYLKNNGFNLRGLTMDSYQSATALQDANSLNIPASVLSLDRKPDGYLAYRQAINEGRIEMYESVLLEKEVTELQQDSLTNKVDHPVDGSKDISDGVVGAYFSAATSKYVEPASYLVARVQNTLIESEEDFVESVTMLNPNVKSSRNIFSEIDSMLDDMLDDDEYY